MKSEDNIYYLMINFDYQKLKIIININKFEKRKKKKEKKSFASLGVGSLLSVCLTSFKHVKKLVIFFFFWWPKTLTNFSKGFLGEILIPFQN